MQNPTEHHNEAITELHTNRSKSSHFRKALHCLIKFYPVMILTQNCVESYRALQWWKLRALLHSGTKFFTVTYSLESPFISCPDQLHPLIQTIDFLWLWKESGVDYSNWRNVNYTLDSTLFFEFNSEFLCNFENQKFNKIKSHGWWESTEF